MEKGGTAGDSPAIRPHRPHRPPPLQLAAAASWARARAACSSRLARRKNARHDSTSAEDAERTLWSRWSDKPADTESRKRVPNDWVGRKRIIRGRRGPWQSRTANAERGARGVSNNGMWEMGQFDSERLGVCVCRRAALIEAVSVGIALFCPFRLCAHRRGIDDVLRVTHAARTTRR